MANNFEKLGFEINATGNAQKMLNNIVSSLEKIRSLQALTKNAMGIDSSGKDVGISTQVVENTKTNATEIHKSMSEMTQAELSLVNTQSTLNQSTITRRNAEIALNKATEQRRVAEINLANAELQLVAVRSQSKASAEKIAIAENNVQKAQIAVTQACKTEETARNSLEKASIGVEKANINVEKSTRRVKQEQEKASNSASRFALRLSTLIFLSRRFGQFFGRAIKESGAYVENLNLFAVTFGKNYQETAQWALDLAHNFGLASNEVIKFTGLFKQLSTAIGIVGETGTQMSTTLTSLGYDLASFFNISVTSAMEKLQAGIFSGQTKPLRSIGIDVTYQSIDNLLKTNEALAQFGTSSKKLDQSQKAIARMILVMQAANNSFGDMANTINTLANQIRIFKGSMIEFKLAVGDLIQEPIRQALIYINGFLIAITNIIRAFKPLSTTSKTGDSQIKNMGDDAEESSEKLDELTGKLTSFDKFNVLGGQQQNVYGGSDITEALEKEFLKQQKIYEETLKKMEEVKNDAQEVAQKIVDWFIIVDENGNFVKWTTNAKILGDALLVLSSIIGVKLIQSILNLGKSLLVTHSKTALIGLSIGLLISGFLKLNSVWENIEPMKRWGIVLGAIAGQIVATVVAFKSLHTTIPVAIAAGLAMAGAIAGIAATVEQSLNSAPGFAGGGITNANLIMTHENGTREWVGKQGSSTAVVNDTQMSDVMRQAVAQGTYQALMSMQENNGGTMEQPINLYIDGDKVFNATRKAAKRQGLDFSRV